MVSSLTVPPAPQAFLSCVNRSTKAPPCDESPRITVTTFPFFRRSLLSLAICFSGGTIGHAGAGHVQASSNSSQTSHRGGRSNSVPANSLIDLWFSYRHSIERPITTNILSHVQGGALDILNKRGVRYSFLMPDEESLACSKLRWHP